MALEKHKSENQLVLDEETSTWLNREKTPKKQKSWNGSCFTQSENKLLRDHIEEYYIQNPGAPRRDWSKGIMSTCWDLAGKAENKDAVWYRLCRNQELEHSAAFIKN